jgi:hypothetical protein
MPENLRGAAAQIWTAYNIRIWEQEHKMEITEIELRERHPENFRRKLEEDGIALASVTKEEADRSHRKAEIAQEVRGFAPRYKEGEIVAVTEQGHVYKLGRRVTGEEPQKVQRFLKSLDRSWLRCIEATRETLKERSTQRIIEVQAFRDLLKDAKAAERLERAGKIYSKAPRRGGRGRVRPMIERIVPSIGVAVAGSAFHGAAKLADGFLSLFDPLLMSAQKLEGGIAQAVFPPQSWPLPPGRHSSCGMSTK